LISEFLSSPEVILGQNLVKKEIQKVMFKPPWFKGGRFVRRSGQPMGHPTSFPLLCTINLSVLNYALELWEASLSGSGYYHADIVSPQVDSLRMSSTYTRKRGDENIIRPNYQSRCDLVERAVRNSAIINGDDFLVVGPPSLGPFLTESVLRHHFVESPGKSYWSRHQGMINSQLFQFDKNLTSFKKCGYVNLGVVYGQNVKTSSTITTPLQVCKDLSEIFKTCPEIRSCFHISIPPLIPPFRKVGWRGDPNWFLPSHLGGLGLVGFPTSISHEQRLVAASFMQSGTDGLKQHIVAVCSQRGLNLRITRLFRPFLSSFRYVPLDVPESSDWKDTDDAVLYGPDSWLARFSMIQNSSLPPGESLPVLKHIRLDKKMFRFKPASDQAILRWWTVKLQVATGLAPPPPLNNMFFRGAVRDPTPLDMRRGKLLKTVSELNEEMSHDLFVESDLPTEFIPNPPHLQSARRL
jgi:hypothetical protein